VEKKAQIGRTTGPSRRHQTWVQTERASHQAFNRLISVAPMAARLANVLIAHMDQGNAVVASQSTLGELLAVEGHPPVHRNTVRRAVQKLVEERWIEVIELGGKGGALAYVVNSHVAWSGSRNGIRYSRFSAQVIASASEQKANIEDRAPLRQIPVLMRGEQPLPSGPDDEPPIQHELEGVESGLPSIERDPNTSDLFEGE